MALTDFLFNGSPPASTTTYGSSTSSLPSWYNDYTQGLISKANAIAATPYQQYTGARIAQFQPDQTQAFSNVEDLAGQYQGGVNSKAFSPASQNIAQAGTTNALNDQTFAGQQAQQAYTNAQNTPGAFDAGSGGIGAAMGATAANAGTNSYQDASNYMSPYLNSTLGGMGQQNAQDLNSAYSNIGDKFAQSGQFGGSRMGSSLGNAANVGASQLAAQQAGAQNTAYQSALGQSQADLARQLQASGQLGSQAATLGGLASTQQQNQANIGNQLGQLSQSDLARQLQAGQAQGNLAQTAAATGLQQNAALEATGSEQQNLNQQSLNQAYQDFQNQVNYPQQQASFLNSIIRGLQIPTTQTTSQTGPASVYQASPLSQLAAAGTGIAGLSKVLGG